MNRPSTVVALILTGGAAALALTGCQPSGPTVVETPSISWEPGSTEPEDVFEQAVLDHEIGKALAFNARDFTIEQLTSTSTDAAIERFYESFRSQYLSTAAAPQVKAGPLPFSVLEVDADGDDAAEVTVCYPQHAWWIEAGHPEPSVDPDAPGQTATYRVGLDGDVLKVLTVEATTQACEVGDLVIGRFDQAPTPPDAIGENDIRPPLED